MTNRQNESNRMPSLWAIIWRAVFVGAGVAIVVSYWTEPGGKDWRDVIGSSAWTTITAITAGEAIGFWLKRRRIRREVASGVIDGEVASS